MIILAISCAWYSIKWSNIHESCAGFRQKGEKTMAGYVRRLKKSIREQLVFKCRDGVGWVGLDVRDDLKRREFYWVVGGGRYWLRLCVNWCNCKLEILQNKKTIYWSTLPPPSLSIELLCNFCKNGSFFRFNADTIESVFFPFYISLTLFDFIWLTLIE